jgi:N-acetylmuramoyl-L-alanine amidase
MMTLAQCGVHILRTILSFIFFTLLSLQPVQASPWDTPGAARAFEEAQLKRSHIEEASQPDLSQYLDCAKTYRKVYLRDPHYEHAPDAIYEEAIVYQQMGDKFGNLEHYRTAARRFQFLVKDYGGNRNCPDALVRLVTIYAAHLKDEDAALEAFQRLKQQYDAKAAVQAAQAEISREPVAQQAEQPTPSTEDERSTEAASVQNIRCWSTNEYTRVIIGLDIDTPYKKALLSKPDRIYFDFANTKLGENLSNRTFTVEDEFLKQVRVGQNHPRVVRVVLDVAAKQSYTVTELHDPFRIVVDFPHQSAAKANLPATPQSVNSTSKSSGEKVAPKHETDVPQAAKQAPLLPAKASDSARQDFGSRKQEPPTAITEITSDKPAEGTPAPTSQPMEVSKTPSPAVASPAVREIKQAGVPLLKDAASSQKTNVAENTGASRPVVGKPDLNATPKAAAPTSLGDRTLTRMLGLKVGRIVIDPGHGGHDFGTTGPGGLLEKDLVLSLARQLKRLIEENMYGEVILTREQP